MSGRARDPEAAARADLARRRRLRGGADGPVRSVAFDRVSGVKQWEEGYSAGDEGFQRQKVLRDIAGQGRVLVREISYQDSGRNWNARPLRELEADLRSGVLDADEVVCAKADRFARDPAKAEYWRQRLLKLGVAVRYLNVVDDGSPWGQFNLRLVEALAGLEGGVIAERMSDGRQRKAELGQVVGGGRPPYGYRYDAKWRERQKREVPEGLVIHAEEARVVADIFGWAAHRSLWWIAGELNRRGVPPRGRPRGYKTGKGATGRGHDGWGYSGVRGLVMNPVYRGELTYGRAGTGAQHYESGIVVPVPRIVSREVWERAQAGRQGRRAGLGGRLPRPSADAEGRVETHALRGRLACGHCGGGIAKGALGYYRCCRGIAHEARKARRDVCPLFLLDQAELEAQAWRHVTGVLRDARTLGDLVEAGLLEHARDAGAREAALAEVRARIAAAERLRQSALDLAVEAGVGSPLRGAYEAKFEAQGAEVGRLRADEAALLAKPREGLSESEARRIERVAAEVRAGLDILEETPAKRREFYALIGLRGVVRYAAVGPVKQRNFGVEWHIRLPLADGGGDVQDGQSVLYLCLSCTPDGSPSASLEHAS